MEYQICPNVTLSNNTGFESAQLCRQDLYLNHRNANGAEDDVLVSDDTSLDGNEVVRCDTIKTSDHQDNLQDTHSSTEITTSQGSWPMPCSKEFTTGEPPIEPLPLGNVITVCCKCRTQEDVTFVIDDIPPCGDCGHAPWLACVPPESTQ